jgi:holo-[acyl-carrier protein] synthase
MIYGAGIDIVEVCRMEEIIRKWGDRFVARVFSKGEITYCAGCALPAAHYAARFAVKESFLKSLGMGLGMGLSLKDIEVANDRRGKPRVRLLGRAADILLRFGIRAVHVSISHTRHSATAIVLLEKRI